MASRIVFQTLKYYIYLSLFVIFLSTSLYVVDIDLFVIQLISIGMLSIGVVSIPLYLLSTRIPIELVEKTMIPKKKMIELRQLMTILVSTGLGFSVLVGPLMYISTGRKIILIVTSLVGIMLMGGGIIIEASARSERRGIEQEIPFLFIFLESFAHIKTNPVAILEALEDSSVFKLFAREIRYARIFSEAFSIGIIEGLKHVINTNPSKWYRQIMGPLVTAIEKMGSMKTILSSQRISVVEKYKRDIKNTSHTLDVLGTSVISMMVLIPALSIFLHMNMLEYLLLFVGSELGVAMLFIFILPPIAGYSTTRSEKILIVSSLTISTLFLLGGYFGRINPVRIGMAILFSNIPISVAYIVERHKTTRLERAVKKIIDRINMSLYRPFIPSTVVSEIMNEEPDKPEYQRIFSGFLDKRFRIPLFKEITNPISKIELEFVYIANHLGVKLRELGESLRLLAEIEEIIKDVLSLGRDFIIHVYMLVILGLSIFWVVNKFYITLNQYGQQLMNAALSAQGTINIRNFPFADLLFGKRYFSTFDLGYITLATVLGLSVTTSILVSRNLRNLPIYILINTIIGLGIIFVGKVLNPFHLPTVP